MQNVLPKTNFWNSLTKQQKWSLVALLFFTLFVMIFWFVQLRQRLVYPLYGNMSPEEFAKHSQNAAANLTAEQTIEIYQKNNDADHDTLSDWDELNLFNTSPYLPDSDGDGIDDALEVKSGTNPNCPEGQVCSEDNLIVNPAGTDNTAVNSGGVITPVDSQDGTDQSTANQQSQAEILRQAFGDNPTPDQLREILINAGGDTTQVNSISDQELLGLYQKMISQ